MEKYRIVVTEKDGVRTATVVHDSDEQDGEGEEGEKKTKKRK